MTKINLFQYLDYRKYLRDLYEESKKSRVPLSLRLFSRRAGFKSNNFLKLVMDGERNLTEASLQKFMIGLHLNKQEQDFFRNLVFFNQAKTHEAKDAYYQKLLRSRKFSELKPMEKDQYEFYSNWYFPVIRELVTSGDFDGTPGWLARRVSPAITSVQAACALEVLEKLNFIKRDEGKWRQTTPLVSTGPEVTSVTLMNYHKNMLDLTKEVLETINPDERDVSALTLGVKESRLPQIKKRIQEFRQEILQLVSSDTDPDQVLQLNMQFFPVSVPRKEKQ